MTQTPDLSCIICTYNRAEYLADTLGYLSDNRFDGSIEVIIVDNNSPDSTRDIANAYVKRSSSELNFRYVHETTQGLSHARNRGIREATAPLLLFLDDDIRVEQTFLHQWLSFFKEHPKVKAAGGRIDIQFDDPRPEWMSSYLLPLLGYHNHGSEIKPYPSSGYPFGGNMAIRQSVFSQYGLFDTNLGRKGKKLIASEEKEFFNRLKSDDIKPLYVPGALIWHRVGSSRLTTEYIKNQATGLGQSLAIQAQSYRLPKKISTLSAELGKWGASVLLFLFYLATLRSSRGWMLLKFRKWIAEGYIAFRSHNTS